MSDWTKAPCMEDLRARGVEFSEVRVDPATGGEYVALLPPLHKTPLRRTAH